ncbi:hypothetical protein [Kitasatospora sp. NPDC004289]
MRSVRSLRATAVRWWPAVLLGAAVVGGGVLHAGPAALAVLAGGWGLALIPVHADRSLPRKGEDVTSDGHAPDGVRPDPPNGPGTVNSPGA